MGEKTYDVRKGKYGFEIYCAEDGMSWEEAQGMLKWLYMQEKESYDG